MKGIPLTEGQKNQIKSLAEQERTNAEIAEMTGISKKAVSKYAKAARATRKTEDTKYTMPEAWVKEWDALHERYGKKQEGQQEGQRPEWKDRMLQTFLSR